MCPERPVQKIVGYRIQVEFQGVGHRGQKLIHQAVKTGGPPSLGPV